MRAFVDPHFLELLVSANVEELKATAQGSAVQNLLLGDLRKIGIGLPSVDEQRRIIAKVDELLALVDQLEARQAAARETCEMLLDATIAELLDSSQPPRREELNTSPSTDSDPTSGISARSADSI